MSEHKKIKATGTILSSALDRYIDTSLAIRDSYLTRDSSATTPPGYPSHVESERQFVAALELKLQKAKLVINQTHNCSTTLVPIHKLPQELLAGIFQFLFESRPKWDYQSRPETVSRVCTQWRNLSLSLPALWRRINLPFNRIIYQSLVTRGKVFASRAYPLPLDVCIFAPYRHPEVSVGGTIASLIHELAPRIRSLDLDTTWKECNLILSPFLPKCKPGVLKTLTTCHESPMGIFFDAPTRNGLPAYSSSRYTDIKIGDSATESVELDRVLASLTTLRLNGFYPFWTSQAYHGLIELRLLRGDLPPENAVISENHLTGILRASPALRILEFSLTIVEALPKDSSISPISLEHLELLNVAQVAPNKLGALLRWVAPGLKPLQLVINLDSDRDVELWRSVVASFFARSQVSKIYTEQGNYETVFFKLLNLCPHLETLACSSIQSSRLHVPEQDGPFISHPTLETLLVLGGSVDTTCLRNVINVINGSPALREILFRKCHYMDGKSSSLLCDDHLQVIAELGPRVKIIDYDLTRDWEIFAS
ncbi:hypothetical protein ACGC1H_003247 [Rhizoctonia solani]